ncbi:hypothetical protein D9M70_520310 [compost metagenome]
MLMLGTAINDPSPMELAQVATRKECEKAELVFWMMSGEAAKERGEDAAPDLYLTCQKRQKQGE